MDPIERIRQHRAGKNGSNAKPEGFEESGTDEQIDVGRQPSQYRAGSADGNTGEERWPPSKSVRQRAPDQLGKGKADQKKKVTVSRAICGVV